MIVVKIMNGSLGKQKLKEYIKAAQPIMHAFLDNEIESAKEFGDAQILMLKTFKDMISAGKGIRGFLIYTLYEACGGTEKDKILDTSTFIEFFHSAILVQDDFMDRDDFRRGLPSTHTVMENYGKKTKVKVPPKHFGYSTAVCLSDVGIFLAWKKLLESDFDNNLVIKAGNLYNRYVIRLALGQTNDLAYTGRDDVDEKDILQVIWTKSGEYTALWPMVTGATLAGETDDSKLKSIEEYAKCFGWAFHIQDDILGLFANEGELGKPVGSDLTEGKNTLLMLHLRKNGTPEQIAYQKSLLGKEVISKEEVEKMKQILVDAGSYKYVYDLGKKYVEDGIKHIPGITTNKELQNVLESLIVYMMERVK